MAWDVVEIISTSGTRDWDSLTAFEIDHQDDTPVDGTICEAQVRGSVGNRRYWGGFQSGMNATTRILITYTEGNKTNGTKGSGDKAIVTNITTGELQEDVNVMKIDWVGLEFDIYSSASALFYSGAVTGHESKVINCLFHTGNDGIMVNVGSEFDVYVGGCLFFDINTLSFHHEILQIMAANSSLTITQCTGYGSLGDGIYQTAGTCLVENTVIASANPDYNGTMTKNNTRSEDGTGTSAGNDVVVTAGVDWTDAPNDDFTIPNVDSELFEAGTAQPSWYTDWTKKDIAGTVWRDTPSIGAFEFPSAPVVNKGSAVIDLNIPKSINNFGFAADGAWHYELDSNKESKITIDRPRIGMAQVIHDAHIYTGSKASPTDHLIAYYKMDDNAASSTIVDETGNNDANWELASNGTDRNTDNDSTTDAKRGAALDAAALYTIDVPHGSGTDFDNDFLKKGSIIITLKPSFAYDTGVWQYLMRCYNSSNGDIVLRYGIGNDAFELSVKWGGVEVIAAQEAYTDNDSLQQWTTILAFWDSDENIIGIAVNGKVHEIKTHSDVPTANQPTSFNLLSNYNSQAVDGIVDEIKLYNGCILPYGGGPFTGNGAVDVDVAHEDILFYVDFEGADEAERCKDKINLVSASTIDGATTDTDKVFGSRCYDTEGADQLIYPVTAHNILNPTIGSLSFWWKMPTYTASDYLFDCLADASNRISIYTAGTGIIALYVAGGETEALLSIIDINDSKWHYIKLTWDADYCELFIDGISQEREAVAGTWAGSITNLYFGTKYDNVSWCDCFFDEIKITNNSNTPDTWAVLGEGPRHMLVREKL